MSGYKHTGLTKAEWCGREAYNGYMNWHAERYAGGAALVIQVWDDLDHIDQLGWIAAATAVINTGVRLD